MHEICLLVVGVIVLAVCSDLAHTSSHAGRLLWPYRLLLPGIDPGDFPVSVWPRARQRLQSSYDPPTRVDRINHIVNLKKGRAVQRLVFLVRFCHHLLEPELPVGWILDRVQFLSVGQLDRAFESHCTELGARPRNDEE